MDASNVTSLLFENLNLRTQKQQVIANNIANINTPGYKTKDLSFNQHLELAKTKNNDLQLYTTHRNHISTNLTANIPSARIFEVKDLIEQNDGNNVNLDTQISQMAQNSMLYNAITNSIRKDASWMKSVVDSSSKT